MQVKCTSLLAGAQGAQGIAVVVDVFRAFTCTPLMFSMGIKGSILVGTPEEALELVTEDVAAQKTWVSPVEKLFLEAKKLNELIKSGMWADIFAEAWKEVRQLAVIIFACLWTSLTY